MISIVIPVFNRFPLVKQMIDSIICQTYSDWELILVDDCSTDGTYDLLVNYVKDQENIHVVQRLKEAKGAPVCRNIGFKMAKGEYVIFFDSDDIISPMCLEQREKFMSLNPHVDAGVFPARHFYNSIDEKHGMVNGIPIFKNDLAAFFSSSLPYIVWNAIFRRESLIEHNIEWDENLLSLQDADFNIQCILRGLKIAYPNKSIIDYFARTENNNSISSTIFNISKYDSHIYFVTKQFEILSGDQIQKYKTALYERIVYTYIIMSRNYSQFHTEALVKLSEKYKCHLSLIKFQFKAHQFLINIFKIPNQIAIDFVFTFFILKRRLESQKRKKFVSKNF